MKDKHGVRESSAKENFFLAKMAFSRWKNLEQPSYIYIWIYVKDVLFLHHDAQICHLGTWVTWVLWIFPRLCEVQDASGGDFPWRDGWCGDVGIGVYIYGCFQNRGTPKWMAYNGKPYSNGWFGGTTIFGNIQKDLQLGGGNSNIFWNVHPENWGKMHPFWRAYFSKGLVQPPTSQGFA